MSDAVPTEPDVLIEKWGGLGRIVLNRPRAINALNHGMVRQIAAALAEWSGDDAVRAVV
ncbi:enoyl-CoA hydratase/isomerase family protein, partial [Rhodococcus opacus]|uniref:enoyl-CoA hydratase/isomerase family protein n=1 Tax=Rhodococcus opacus TaxID=37919 RepID=UPI003AF54AE8